MDETDRIKKAIRAGDYFAALGLSDRARKIDIDIAAEKLCRAYPEISGLVSGIAQAVGDADKRKIYDIACSFRDGVILHLADRFERFAEAAPACHETAWNECQRILRCDFEKGEVKIGANAAASIADHGVPWIAAAVIQNLVTVIAFSDEQKQAGRAHYWITERHCARCAGTHYAPCPVCQGMVPENLIPVLADHPENLCQFCNGRKVVPCDCQDLYDFSLPPGVQPGAVVTGCGERTGKTCYAIVDRHVPISRPVMALLVVYQGCEYWGRVFPAMADISLDEAMFMLRQGAKTMALLFILLSGIAGVLAGSWLTGIAVGIAMLGEFSLLHKYQFHPKFSRARRFGLLFFLPVALGTLAGYILSTWKIGAIIGSVLSTASLLFILLAVAVEHRARR